MNVIHLLPDTVANQIAAGEVIQRPASVIKELMENSIDAGATEVNVLVQDAGRTQIQVIDNGCGMNETDARLAFERHATSKISTAQDLYSLSTMGFRGEALASIAAVAQVELLTRTANDELGIKLCISGADIVSQEPCATPKGSRFSVKNLFFNVPARRRFLKSDTAEMRHIVNEFLRVALAHPTVGMSLSSNGQILYNLVGGNVKQRVAGVAGLQMAKQLLPIDSQTSLVKIHGFIGTPKTARKSGSDQYFFANDRYMRSAYFNKAVMDAYKGILPPDHTPAYYIYLNVSPDALDVNVHPQKTEIKFDDEQAIWRILNATISSCLNDNNILPQIDFDSAERIDIPTFDPAAGATDGYDPFAREREQAQQYAGSMGINPCGCGGNASNIGGSTNYGTNGYGTGYSGTGYSAGGYGATTGNVLPGSGTSARGWESLYGRASVPSQGTFMSSGANAETDQASESNSGLAADLATAPIGELDNEEINVVPEQQQLFTQSSLSHIENIDQNKILQYRQRYIVMPTPSGLLFVDQHRAHERILYDRMHAMVLRSDVESQRMLFPETVTMGAEDICIVSELTDELGQVGIDVTIDNEAGTVDITSIPALLDIRSVRDLIETLAYDCRCGETDIRGNVVDRMVLKLVIHGAMPYGRTLSVEEMRQLLKDLMASPQFGTAPDGKPTMRTLSDRAIDQMFGI